MAHRSERLAGRWRTRCTRTAAATLALLCVLAPMHRPASALATQPLWHSTDPGLPMDPQPRSAMAAAYDPDLGGVVVLGGFHPQPPPQPPPPPPPPCDLACTVQDTINATENTVICTVGSPNPGDCEVACCGPPPSPPSTCFAAGVMPYPPVPPGVWLWRNSRWSRLVATAAPGPLLEAAAAYDPSRHEVVVLGLAATPTGGLTMETWTLSGTRWTLRHPATTPPARHSFSGALAYDGATHSILLFGGWSAASLAGGGAPLGDTWLWDGAAWTQVQPAASPTPRGGAALAWDPALGRTVLVGGLTGSQSSGAAHGCAVSIETWAWDGTSWTQFAATVPIGPAPRASASLAYDQDTHSLVLFGGLGPFCNGSDPGFAGGCAALGDTWLFNGRWSMPSIARDEEGLPSSPSARWGAALATEPQSHGVLLFGGQADLYTPDDDTWKLATFTAP